MKIDFDLKVKRKLKKLSQRNIKIYGIFLNKINVLLQNPKDESLRIHKLAGRKINLWSFSITYSYRAIFIYTKEGILITDVGSHDEVY